LSATADRRRSLQPLRSNKSNLKNGVIMPEKMFMFVLYCFPMLFLLQPAYEDTLLRMSIANWENVPFTISNKNFLKNKEIVLLGFKHNANTYNVKFKVSKGSFKPLKGGSKPYSYYTPDWDNSRRIDFPTEAVSSSQLYLECIVNPNNPRQWFLFDKRMPVGASLSTFSSRTMWYLFYWGLVPLVFLFYMTKNELDCRISYLSSKMNGK
jgi:hypothetical protein